ncbi:MAG: RNA methyltransferase [Candidatus Andersenbacteria bacterium CG10_big_fil_rev_8_21_14_0_10_54_11]|uniref:RNA methyltransferase n=1 Tax=Candidatus Andersenbacteria bacterium CG10_big_fil_rev_8_21_14_0_10_54_11 TaxID=1974485 RepID=A0A2M6X003_9BACT|nr:MAG: RNA methyltransferase [Candidatus Andersenbacteria bacterium CG10_big_fil_rev_8_21_14_0_10_54_11]
MPRKKTTAELVGERPSPEELTQLPRLQISVIADNIRSLDNVGLIFRTCELARLEHLYLTGYTGYPRREGDTRPETIIQRHDNRIRKTAVYAIPHQPWSHIEDPVPLVQQLKADGYCILALEQTDQSIPYHHVPITDYRLPMTLVLGHERQGVREELLSLADQVIDIPIKGHGNSHNVAISAAIVLYHILEKTGKLG